MRAEGIFWLFAALYLLLALVSKLLYPELGRPELWPLVYALLFLGAMFLGFRASPHVPPTPKVVLYLLLFGIVLGLTDIRILALSTPFLILLVLFIHCRAESVEENSTGRLVWFTGLTLLVGFTLGAILLARVPLLDPAMRYSQFRILYLAAGYTTVVLLSAKPDWRLLLWGIALGIVSTFRTIVLAVTLAYLFREILDGKRGINVRLFLVICLGIVAGVVARYYATLSSYPTWHLGIIESLIYRPGVTYTVYEKLFSLGIPWGHHKILFLTNPKLYVGKLFGRNVGYTYTLFGQPVYDFGFFGLGEGVLLGMALRDSLRLKSTGAMALTLLTLAIPIGIDAFFFAALMALGMVATGVMACRPKPYCL